VKSKRRDDAISSAEAPILFANAGLTVKMRNLILTIPEGIPGNLTVLVLIQTRMKQLINAQHRFGMM